MRDKNVSPLPQIRSFGIRFESRKKFHAQTVLVPSIWSLKLPVNHSHPDPPDTPYMPSYSLLPVTARREPHVCNQRSTICTCTGQLLRPVTHVSASEENVSCDWQLRLAAMWWERGTVPARATRRIKILVATAANYSRTSPTGIVSVTKRATYVVLSYTVYVNEPRSDPLNSPTRTSRAKIETDQFRETLQDRKPRGDSPIFEVVKPVLRKRIGMPTCDCQNGTLDESEEHVCSLKPPVEKDKVKEPKESPNPVRYSDGSVRLRNPNIELMDQDILYHLALGSGSHDLVEMFGDIKFVCMGGTPKRMEHFANYIMQEIGHKLPAGTTLLDITKNSYRYSMFKVGPVLSISHGMGIPSVSILLHEVIKLMYHAKIRDPIFIRIGTCGGIGHEGGTVIISEEALDETMKPYLELMVLGKLIRRPAKLDRQLARDLKALAHRDDPYDTVIGKTMCSNDFYEGQGRLDGAFCEFTEADKMEYLTKLQKAGVVNIEMESLCFAALTHHAGIQSAVVCVTLLDRLKGDQVLAPKEVLEEWQMRPQKLIARYITTYLQRKGRLSLEGQHGSMYVKSPRRFKLVQQESENYD